jgi:mannosyltransferase OCH1-like enzyme
VPPPDLLAPLFAISAPERRALTEAARRPVPKVLHQIWIGGPAPVSCAAWANWAGRHSWRHRLWDEAQLAAAGATQDPVFRAMLQAGDLPGAVDVARYHVLSQQGGVYLDCDWYPARDDRPLEAALPMLGLAALAEPAPRLTSAGSLLVSNALIAAPPQHPVFARLIAALPAVARALPDGPAWWVTGPLPFTLAARGGPMSLLDAGIVAAVLPRRAPMAEVDAVQARTVAEDGPGLLIGWKSW